MVLGILCVEPIYLQYSGVLETCLALRYWFFEVLGSESAKGKPDNFPLVIILKPCPIDKKCVSLDNTAETHAVPFVIFSKIVKVWDQKQSLLKFMAQVL